MKRMALTALLVTATSAFAGGTGNHSHGEMMEVGQPGDPSHVDRTVEILMLEPEAGGMIFEPSSIEVRKGETLRLKVVNKGASDHELVVDTMARNEDHRAMMEKFPEMEHDDPNAIRLAPGAEGEIVWTFMNTGDFQFACLIPGHMEAGMHGPIKVN